MSWFGFELLPQETRQRGGFQTLGFRIFMVGVAWGVLEDGPHLEAHLGNPPKRTVLGFRVSRVGLGLELAPKGIHQRGQF